MTRLRKAAMTCGAGVGADLGGVLGGGVADVVQRLDRQCPRSRSASPAGLACMNGRLVMASTVTVVNRRGLACWSRVLWVTCGTWAAAGEGEAVDGDGLEGAQLHTAVAAVAGAVQDRDAVPRQAGAAGQQGRPVGLGPKQVVGLLVPDQELGGLRMGLQRVGGGHQPGQVQGRQQRLERADSSGAPTTWRWTSTARVVWSIAASRCTGRPSPPDPKEACQAAQATAAA
jgi:hypothetical protein